MKTAILLLLGSVDAAAQMAAISGLIQDPSGAAIPNAIIRIANEANGASRIVQSNEEGIYAVSLLLPGNYSISAEAAGFRTFTRKGVNLAIGQSARVDFELQLAAAGQSVTVNTETSLLRTDSAAVSTVIDRRFLETLPLNGRSFQTLIALTPGVVMTKADFGEQGNSASTDSARTQTTSPLMVSARTSE